MIDIEIATIVMVTTTDQEIETGTDTEDVIKYFVQF